MNCSGLFGYPVAPPAGRTPVFQASMPVFRPLLLFIKSIQLSTDTQNLLHKGTEDSSVRSHNIAHMENLHTTGRSQKLNC